MGKKKITDNTITGFEDESKKASFNPLDVFKSELFSKKSIIGQIPFILFLTFLAIVNIWNGYNTKKILNDTKKIENELKQLRTEQVAVASELMIKSRQSSVINIVNKFNLGLRELVVPPSKIVIQNK